MADGFIDAAGHLRQYHSQVVVGLRIIRTETERVFQVNDGFERPVCFRQLEPQVVLRFRQVVARVGVIRIDAERGFILGDGLAPTARLSERVAEVVVRDGQIRRRPLRQHRL